MFYRWFNDSETTYYMFTGQRPKTLEQIKNLVEAETRSEENTIFVVCDKKTGKPIGRVGLYELDHTVRKAEMRIIIGESAYRGKGLGTEVVELITFYGFDRLNLNRVYLGVTHENKGAVRAYEKAGYAYEGTLKDDIYRNSRYYDSMRMALLRAVYYRKFYPKQSKRFGGK